MERNRTEREHRLAECYQRMEREMETWDFYAKYAKEQGARAFYADCLFYYKNPNRRKLTDQERLDNPAYNLELEKAMDMQSRLIQVKVGSHYYKKYYQCYHLASHLRAYWV